MDPNKDEKHANVDAIEKELDSSSFLEEVDALRLSLRGFKLTAAITFVTGTGFTLFGSCTFFLTRYQILLTLGVQFRYDQGVMSSLLTARQVSICVLEHPKLVTK